MALNDVITIRLPKASKIGFVKKCEYLGINHSDLLREMVDAVIEGRVKITKKAEVDSKLEEIYEH